MSTGDAEPLQSAWGSGPNDVFAVGSSGTILRYDGQAWSAMSSPTTSLLYGIWGSGPNNVFAVGKNGVVIRYDGANWLTMSSATPQSLYGVWGTGPNNVFAVGDSGTIARFNGSAWSTMASHTTEKLNGVWGTAPSNVFAVGSNGTILQFNGSVWSAMTSNTTATLNDVWGSGPSDIFVVGSTGSVQDLDGIVAHYNGSAWAEMDIGGLGTGPLSGVWGVDGQDVFAIGTEGDIFSGNLQSLILHYDGTSWLPACTSSANLLSSVWGIPYEAVYAIGLGGSLPTLKAAILRFIPPRPQYTLTTAVDGQGSVEPSGGAYAKGTELPITAIPAQHWHFVEWQGDLSGSDNPTVLTMDANKAVHAVFEPNQVTLSVTWEGQGGVEPNGGTYDEGNQVTLTATPDAHWHFVEWQGDLSGWTNPIQLTLASNKAVHAVFEPNQVMLTATWEGQGRVDPNGGTFDEGGEITVTAIHDEGWHFVEWQQDLTGPNNPAGLVMDADKIIHAVFQINQYVLSTQVSGQGSVDPNGGTYNHGTPLTLTATADTGWHFLEWQGDVSGPNNPIDLTMDANKVVRAVFQQDEPPAQYVLTTAWSGDGRIQPNGGTYDEGTIVTVTAIPDESWRFVEWQQDLAGSENPTELTMDANKTVHATFARTQHTLTCTWNAQGVVEPNGGVYDHGTLVTLAATASQGWHFVEWTGDASGPNTPIELTMDADKAVQATFARNEVTLTTDIEGQGTVEPNSGTYFEGDSVVLTAAAAAGWHFVAWSMDATGSTNPLELTMDGDKTARAIFARNEVTLTTEVVGQGRVDPNGGAYYQGDEITLTATADDGWQFYEWQGDLTGPNNPAHLTMDAAKTIQAVFAESAPNVPNPTDPNNNGPCCCGLLGGPMLPLLGVALVLIGLWSGPRRRRTRRP